MFATPPGFHTRGSGWFSFAYATLATGILVALLLFYSTPSKAERLILGSTFFFLFVNATIILCAYPLRNGENWVGIVSVLWALWVTAWAIMCDRVVEYGKREEEQRLTGRCENRKSLREWCSVFTGSTTSIIFLVIAILFTINLSICARDATLPAPGNRYFVDGNKYQVHVFCTGNKTDQHGNKLTTVFLEAGEDPVERSFETWIRESFDSSHGIVKRYCYWDRPGIAWSENAPSPLSAGMAVDALSEALRNADESGPWILVSHGIGGIYSRIFASRHAAEVQGLLLIDTTPESLLSRVGSPARGFLLWLRGVIYPLGLDRLVSTILLQHSREDRVFGRDAYQSGGQIKAKLQENLVAKTFTRNEIEAAKAILPKDTPVVVVSSGHEVKRSKAWFDGQRALSMLPQKVLAWDVVDGARHEVWRNDRGRDVLEKRLLQLEKA